MNQIIWKLEADLKEVELYYQKSREILVKGIKNKKKGIKQSIDHFLEFVVAFPVDIEPINLVKKMEHIMTQYEDKYEYFAKRIADEKDREKIKDIKFTLMSTTGLYQMYKVLRHYILTIKKTNNLQLAIVLQMTMPMITKIAKAQMRATESFAKEIPIGDTIGPLIAASLLDKPAKEVERDVVLGESKIKGRKVYVMKASGPGAALGKVSDAVKYAIEKKGINHIITIDAAAKLEGEKTGSIARGVGVMMGGIGVERHKIEDLAVKYDIPLDGLVIKMSAEEASIIMKKEILNAWKKARKELEDMLDEIPKDRKILIIGVGNTVGVGNSRSSINEAESKLKKFWRVIKNKKEWKDYFDENYKEKKMGFQWQY